MGQYRQEPGCAFALLQLGCTLLTLVLLAAVYLFIFQWLWSLPFMRPPAWLAAPLGYLTVILYVVSVFGSYAALRRTTLNKYLFQLNRRMR